MNWMSRCALVLIASLGSLSAAGAQTYFSGTVVDANNQPIAGATIQAGHMAPLFGPFTLDGQASTDAQGHYAITTLAAGDGSGNYVIIARATGRVTIVYPNTTCPSENICPFPGFPPTVAVPNSAVEFQLFRPGSISGHVRRTDTNGDVANLPITLGAQSTPTIDVTTDSSGNYFIGGLLPNSYEVETGYGRVPDQYALLPQRYAGHDFDPVSDAPFDWVAVGDGENVTGIDFAVDVGGAIAGQVVSALDGEALATEIGLQRLTPVSSGSGFAMVAGTVGYATQQVVPPPPGQYVIQPLLPGTFKLLFTTGGPVYLPNYYADATTPDAAQTVTVTGTATTGGIDAHLMPLQTIAGTITDAVTGQPLPNIVVHAGPPLPDFGTLEDFTQSLTDASGKYLLQGLPPGSHYVWTYYTPGYLDQVYPDALGCCFAPAGSQPLALAAGQQMSGIDMAISRGAYAVGRIHDAATGAAPLDAALLVFDAGGRELLFTNVDATGHFTTDTLPTGDYYLAAFIGGHQIYYPDYRCDNNGGSCDLSQAQKFSFSAPQPYSVDFPIAHLDEIFGGGFEP